MDTYMWIVDNFVDKSVNKQDFQDKIVDAARFLREGEVIAFPTETVYGLGANALDSEAVKKIYLAKGRPSDNPLIVHISNRECLREFVIEVSKKANQLMETFWPGPMTLVFYKQEGVFPEEITAGLNTVAIRMPGHPIALALIEEAGVPIAAPSANLSGRPSPTSAKHVMEDMNGRIAGIIDGGNTGIGLESTVIDVTGDVPVILRLGGITKEQIEECVGEVAVDPGLLTENEIPKSPGMKYKHYAPKMPFILVAGSPSFLQQQVNNSRLQGKKVGVYSADERVSFYQADIVIGGGPEDKLEIIAEKMYGVLRDFDHTDVDLVYGEVFREEGIGQAIMNRLHKAAGNQIIKE